MRKRKYNLLQRIFIKANSVLYTMVGKLVDALTRKGWWGEFPYEVKGHFGDVIHVEHAYPENFQPGQEALFDEWKSYDTFPHDLFFAKDAWLTSDGAVLKKRWTFVKALPHPVFRFQFGMLYNWKVRLFYREFKTDPAKKYLLFYDNWSWNNYFHWIIDALCRAELVRENVKEHFTIVLPEASPKFLTETLKLYGYTDFEYLPERSRTRIAQLYAMNYAAWSGQQHPVILRRMVEFVKSKTIADVIPEKRRRIYVSRAKQFSRRVENETEVEAVLQSFGFETIYWEGMPFAEQVRTMQSAEIFVTSHGANMTNLIFLPSGAKILELINDRKPNFCYWSVADSLGLDYYYQLCAIGAADHVRVEVEVLKKNLQQLTK